MTIVHRTRGELVAAPISAAITTRGKELSVADTVADARRLFATHSSVQALPVLDGTAYAGAVERGAIADDVPAEAPIAAFVTALLPTAVAETPAGEALAVLDRQDANRLVVLASDGITYVGLVCLRGDRERLCVDAECHADPTQSRGHAR